MSGSTPPSGGSNRLLLWGAAGSGLLMLAGLGAFAYASQLAATRAAGQSDGAVTVTLRDNRCQPNALTVPAGRTLFRVVNETDRAVEWEILDGVMVLEERENIAPGLSQTLAARLRPGEYAVTCGLLSNPRGILTVTPSADSGGANERPALTAFIGPLAEYQVFVALQSRALARDVAALDEAIRAGDLAAARALYTEARAPYARLAPVAGRIGDLANAIDPLATYLEKREEDPAFTGFHRIEYGLFARGTLDGLAPISARLVADVDTLQARLRALRLRPETMGEGAVRSLGALADTLSAGGAELYAHSDLADAEATLAGVAKIVTLVKPVATDAAPGQFGAVESALASVNGQLAALREGDRYPDVRTMPELQRAALVDGVKALGQVMDQLNAAVGFGQDGA
ncbi:iron uptake system protein EfeO [Aureimonas sp. AU20]|uniref:iron uptake system protein EfeO n=1 Tax=Aureimonas sp. AU20 TaxID=1349819 RepID=UPI000783EEC3|nr:iron uptake system protein EfeO [Aureimonas sp. AU20]